MSIIRVAKRRKFTVVCNTPINDSVIDYDVLGLLVYLLSKPDGWNVSINHLVKQKESGETKIRRMLGSLQDNGYAEWKRLKSGRVEWLIYEMPQGQYKHEADDHISPYGQNPHVDKPHVEKPRVENNHDIVKTQPLVKTDNKVKTDIAEPPKKATKEPKSSRTWDSYSRAYLHRYRVAPNRSAKVNKLLCLFVDEVGQDDAPQIAAYYLNLNERWYQQKAHDVPTLLQSATAIRTQWATGTNKTNKDYQKTERISRSNTDMSEIEAKIRRGDL